jgi:hypothetical protein
MTSDALAIIMMPGQDSTERRGDRHVGPAAKRLDSEHRGNLTWPVVTVARPTVTVTVAASSLAGCHRARATQPEARLAAAQTPGRGTA